MDLEILRMLIEKRNNAINKSYQKSSSQTYLEEAKNNLEDDTTVITSYLHMVTKRPIEQCQEIVNGLNIDDIKFTEAEFTVIADFITNLKENSSLKEIKDFFQTNGFIQKIKNWKAIDADEELKTNILAIKSLIKKHNVDVTGLFTLLEEDYETFLDITNLVIDSKSKNNHLTLAIVKKVLYARMELHDVEYSESRRDVRAGRINLESARNQVKKYVEEIEREEKNRNKQVKLETYYNEQALELLEKELKKTQITNIRPLIKRIVDPAIKEIILIIIYKHNLEYLKELNNEYNELMSNSTARYLSLLHEFDISATEEELVSITHLGIEDTKSILKILKGLNISLDSYMKILSSTNIKTIIDIKELLNKSYISKEVLNSNIMIFNKNNILLNIIKTNIEIINKHQINPTIFSEKEKILLMDSNLLEKSLETIEKYNLIKSLKNSHDFGFLFNVNLSSLIDKYLELGYEKILEEDLDVLNYKDTRRLVILRNMGIELEKNEIVEMHESDKFFIPDEMLDDYIPVTSTYLKEEELNISKEELLSYKKTNRTLEIAGHLISINKILMSLESDSLKNTLFKNMNIDLSAYEEIIKELNGQSYIK